MITAQEARDKVKEFEAKRTQTIIAWVESELPAVEKAILEAVGRTAHETTYQVTVLTHNESPSLYLEALVARLQQLGYQVTQTYETRSSSHNPGCIYNLSINFSAPEKVRR